MAKLLLISGFKAVKAFSKAGWVASRQTRNHVIMEKIGHSTTLMSLIKDAGLTVEEFVELL